MIHYIVMLRCGENMRFSNIESYRIEIYRTSIGREPFNDWLSKLSDCQAYQKIFNRIDSIQLGNLGDCRGLKNGLFEIRIYYGPGYRIYGAFIKINTILRLCAGTKKRKKRILLTQSGYLKNITAKENHD